MSMLKKLLMINVSLGLAGLMVFVAISLVAAAGNWQAIGVDGGWVFEIVAVPTNPTTLYARAGDALFSGAYFEPGAGLWKSADAGATWQLTGLPVEVDHESVHQGLTAVAVVTNGQNIYVSSLIGQVGGPTPQHSRLWRSADGGNSWNSVVLPNSNIFALAHFSSAGRIIAGSDPGAIGGAPITRPLFYGSNGAAWNLANVTPITANIHTLAESGGGFMYAGGEADNGSGYNETVYTSTDGVNWTQAYIGSDNEVFMQIVADPTNVNRAYALVGGDLSPVASAAGTVYSTTNRGQSWTELPNQPGMLFYVPNAMAIDSQGWLYVATTQPLLFPLPPVLGAVYRSTDQGNSWGLLGQAPSQKSINHLTVDPNSDSVLYFASIANDNSAGVYKTPASYQVGATAFEFVAANTDLRAYPVNGIAALNNTVYAATGASDGLLISGQGLIQSANSGQSWSRSSSGESNYAGAVAIHPTNPNIAYFGGLSSLGVPDVWRTTDSNLWVASTSGWPDLPSDLAIDPTTPATIYGASSFGLLAKSTDSGQNWTPLTGLAIGGTAIAVHPTNPLVLYATHTGPTVTIKSSDGGLTWTDLITSSGCGGNDVLVNPITPSTVYAMDCQGVFLKSLNDGAAWTPAYITASLGLTTFKPSLVPFPPLFGQLAYDSKAGVIYAALHQYGLVSSSDDGVTWSRVMGDGLPSVMILSVFYQADKDILYVGTAAGLYARSAAGGIFLPIIRKNS
ncbi:MAG: hypothetical protein JW953_03890 [Anaerolineae bacterium]|nr:hypothetical protein [Anaerolineae bacterium]